MEAKQLVAQPCALAPAASRSVQVSSTVDATLPLPVSQKWVSHACRMAGVARPRWDRYVRVWTTTARRDDGALETITIRHAGSRNSVTIDVSWDAPEDTPAETATARRLVTSFVTGMWWSLRHEKRTRTPLV